MELRFPLLSGGEAQGLNDAGVETFEGEVGNYLARECAQNVGDSAGKGVDTVEITFDLKHMSFDEFPCLSDAKNIFQACKDYWPEDEDARDFFDKALSCFDSDNIPVLKISDFGTTGLTGGDSDRHDKWFALVRSKGASVKKDRGAGGSYGIGKFAPFAASALRTVFYSTRTETGGCTFQGVLRVATHENEDGQATQGTGYIGNYDPVATEFKSIRQDEEIPEVFCRTQPGTDIYIPAYKSFDNWEKDFLISILNNFWPAVFFKKIKFRVGHHKINHENLKSWIEDFADEIGFDAGCYYRALTDPSSVIFEEDLPCLGRCRLYLVLGNTEDKKLVAMIRRNAMIIDYWRFQPPKPFSGLFVCDNDVGNNLLRKMEPPRHDKFDPARLEGGTAVLNSIRSWIRECIKTLMPKATGSRFELDDVARYLPDEEDKEESDLSGEQQEDRESLRKVPNDIEKKPLVAIQSVQITSEGSYGSGNEDADNGGGTTYPKAGDGKNTGGKVAETGLDTKEEGALGVVRSDVKCRAVHLGGADYRLILRTAERFSGKILLQAIGDDGNTDSIKIISMHEGAGTITSNGCVSIDLDSEEPISISVQIDIEDRLSLKGVAYEN